MDLSGFQRAWMRLDLSGWTCTGLEDLDGFYWVWIVFMFHVSFGVEGFQWVRMGFSVFGLEYPEL